MYARTGDALVDELLVDERSSVGVEIHDGVKRLETKVGR
jgi:hypothetical protein